MSHITPEMLLYASHAAFLRNSINQLPVIPEDWALQTTNVASEWLALCMAYAYQHPIKLDIDIIRYNEALAKRDSRMNDAQEDALLTKFPPTKKIMLSCPSVVIDSGYRIIIWYVPDGLSPWVQSDMYAATVAMGDLLKKSITDRKGSGWRTQVSNFQPSRLPGILPGCINITPCWFQQGHKCYGPPPENLDNGFKPKVSATLKGDRSLSMIMGHAKTRTTCLYWASIRTHVELGRWSVDQGFYPHAVMQLTNLGIDLAYNLGVMYNPAELDAYKLARYNQVNFMLYGTL
ncbi:hypothetical protein EV702DRAFT_1046320 [Suillus placidus]|uniref:Uncharacterized protein n=1 Tax=Suillus placidus TaxID=48579 RepID=A0A9P6ZSX4_9AGAM|nr:hypothetical protein EV702DRAFT_1046320 [Suillus placidus]